MSSPAPARAVVRAFLSRDLGVALSYRVPFVFDVLSAGFSVFSFYFLSRIVPASEVPGGYLAFVMVGLALGAFLQAGVVALAGNLRQEQVQGTLEVALSCGISVPALAGGMAAYPLASAVLRALVYAVLAAAVGARAPGADWGLAVAALVLGSVSFAGLGLIGAALVVLLRQAERAVAWLVSLLTLIAGVIFPLRVLPGWLEWTERASPFTQTLKILRAALLEGKGWADVWSSLASLLGLTVAAAIVGLAGLAASLARARRTGALAQY